MLNSTGTPVQWKGGQDGPWGTGGPFFPLKRPKSSSGGRTGSKIKRWKAIFSVLVGWGMVQQHQKSIFNMFLSKYAIFPTIFTVDFSLGWVFFCSTPWKSWRMTQKGNGAQPLFDKCPKIPSIQDSSPLAVFFKVKSALCVMQCNSHNSPATSHHHAPTK